MIISCGNLNYEFPFSSINDFMDQIEHFLACKSAAVSTRNSYRFDTGLHQLWVYLPLLTGFYLKRTVTRFRPWWDWTTDPLSAQACALHFGLRSSSTLIGCSEFCVEDPTPRAQPSAYAMPAWQTEGCGLSSFSLSVVANLNEGKARRDAFWSLKAGGCLQFSCPFSSW